MEAMGGLLPLVGIAAVLVLGFVVLITALAHDSPVKSDSPRDRALARQRRRLQQEQLKGLAQQASSAGHRAVGAAAVALRNGVALAHEWWKRVRYDARDGRVRRLSLESTAGQVIAAASISVIAAYLIVTFG